MPKVAARMGNCYQQDMGCTAEPNMTRRPGAAALLAAALALAVCTGCAGSEKIGSDAGPADGAAADAPRDTPSAADAGPTCPGENPAHRCRTSADLCLPSKCGCENGTWACTEDCGGGRDCSDGGPSDTGGDGPTQAVLCAATGGTVKSASCCAATADFPNTCSVGACGCAPANSVFVSTCECPTGACFTRERGCAVPVCTPGANQTCNDNPAISSLHGQCQSDGTCKCNSGFAMNPGTGRCL